jgi:hypothetical protein
MTAFHNDGRVVVNSIEIPPTFVGVAGDWYGGQGCMLYAVCSTGGLTTGTNCPVLDYTDDADRDQKWYYSIWCDLSADVGSAECAARKAVETWEGDYNCDEYEELVSNCRDLQDFEDWVDNTVLPMLAAGYPALEDWDE